MLKPEQLAHFDTFGFLLFPQAFTKAELETIVSDGEKVWAAAAGTDEDKPEDVHCSPFLERHPSLARLVEDDRLCRPVEQLVGTGFVWGGSEGAWCKPGVEQAHHWHSDRVGEIDLDYVRLKYMIYLQPMRREEGALRVLPGSHRSTLHRDLASKLAPGKGRLAENGFGVRGDQLPSYALEVEPGDLVLFNHYLFHGVYGKRGNRRYIALKYAAAPRTEAQYEALRRHGQDASRLASEFRHSERPRVRAMVDGLLVWEEKLAARTPAAPVADSSNTNSGR